MILTIGSNDENKFDIFYLSPGCPHLVSKELDDKFELEFTLVCILLVTTLVTVGLVDKNELESNPGSIIVIEAISFSRLGDKFELKFIVICVLLVTTLVTVGLVDKAELESNPASTIVIKALGSHKAEVVAGTTLVIIKVTPGSNEENRFDIKYYNYNYYRTSHLNYSPQFELLIDSKFYLYE